MTTQPVPDPIPHQIAALVESRLAALSERYAQYGRSLDDIGSPEELADQMVALVPKPSAWDEAIGPFYTTSSVGAILGGISRQAVADRRRRHTVFALQTSEGDWVYPAFQFRSDGSVISALGSMQQRIADGLVDGWTLAGWLTANHASLGGVSVVEWIRNGGDEGVVDSLASDLEERSR